MVYSPYASRPDGQRRETSAWVQHGSFWRLIASAFRGQEGSEDAPMHSHLGVVGVTGILMRT
jgi:hypothetical protein